MTIRIPLLGGTNFSDGEGAPAADMNDTFVAVFLKSLTLSGLNIIRQLQDRSITFSKGGIDGWGEAYTDLTGRMNSVSSLTGAFSTNKITRATSLTVEMGAIVGTDNSTDRYIELKPLFTGNIVSLQARWAGTGGNHTIKLYKNGIVVHDFGLLLRGNGTLYTYTPPSPIAVVPGDVLKLNNETNSTSIGYYHSTGYTANPYFSSVGLARPMTANSATTLEVVFNAAETLIEHTITAGVFGTTISSAIGIPMIIDWEDGANIQYKLTNASEDSGWLNYNEPCSFTAFTSQPTKLIVKLIPKSSSPTAGYPSIAGFSIFAK